MYRNIHVALDERKVVLRDGLPISALGPGRHRLWGWSLETRSWSTAPLVFDMPAELRAVLPESWFDSIELGPHERAILWHDGQPRAFLGPGIHRYWLVDDSIRVVTYSVHEAMPELTAEMAVIVPRDAYVDVTVLEHERGLLYMKGRLVQTLGPGRYAYWTTRESPVSILKVDVRGVQTTLASQELMTRDKVTLRVTLTVEHAIDDAALSVTATTNVRDALYLMVQLAARQYIGGVTLDELLGGRDSMARFLEDETRAQAKTIGVRVERVGVKDVVLPGEMKTLLNKVIEAEKEALANVILRREETAATRSLANTAKVMADNPILLRLKELESLKEIAASVRELRIVTGQPDALGALGGALLPRGLLAEAPAGGASEDVPQR